METKVAEHDVTISGETAKKPSKAIVIDNKMLCKACNKRVYELEKLVMGDVTYHKTCFRCQNCNCVLRLNNFAALNGKNYCKPHFIEAFKLKGNYESGFVTDEDKVKAKTSDEPQKDVQTDENKVHEKTNPAAISASKPASTAVNGSKPAESLNGSKEKTLHKTESVIKEETATKKAMSPSKAVSPNTELPAGGTVKERREELKTEVQSKTTPAETELTPTNVTRNMLKRFESLSRSDSITVGGEMGRRESIKDVSNELPAADTTRNLLAKFRSMEDQSRPPPNPMRAEQQRLAAIGTEAKSSTLEKSGTEEEGESGKKEIHKKANIIADRNKLDNNREDSEDLSEDKAAVHSSQSIVSCDHKVDDKRARYGGNVPDKVKDVDEEAEILVHKENVSKQDRGRYLEDEEMEISENKSYVNNNSHEEKVDGEQNLVSDEEDKETIERDVFKTNRHHMNDDVEEEFTNDQVKDDNRLDVTNGLNTNNEREIKDDGEELGHFGDVDDSIKESRNVRRHDSDEDD